MKEYLGQTIDQLISIEVRPIGLLNNVVPKLYRISREKMGEPLAWGAARFLVERCRRDQTVIVITGHVHPALMPHGETDGPPGAVALARVLHLGLGLRVILLCDQPVVEVLQRTVIAAGLLPISRLPYSNESPAIRRIYVDSIPIDPTLAKEKAKDIFSNLSIGAVISVEKIGPNRAGILHSGFGNDLTGNLGRADILVEEAKGKQILSIGIGDLGNEIGFGSIVESVRKNVPYAGKCLCPCGQGSACVTSTDVLVVAGTSNWGAYGIEASLSAQLGKADLIHTGEMEYDMIRAACKAGAVDGLSSGPTLEVDGIPAATHVNLVELLRSAVQISCSKRVIERVQGEAPPANKS